MRRNSTEVLSLGESGCPCENMGVSCYEDLSTMKSSLKLTRFGKNTRFGMLALTSDVVAFRSDTLL